MSSEIPTQETTRRINGNFNFIAPTIAYSLIQGEDAEALYNEVSKTMKRGVWYDEESKTLKGSSTFLAARIDRIVRSLGQRMRVATLADLSRPEIMEVIGNRFYADTPAIVFRSTRDDLGQNKATIKELAPLIEQKTGRLRLPVLVTGFDVSPSRKSSHELQITLREDFSVLHDERLSGEYNRKQFSTVDKDGLPNFDSKGSRTWHAISEGISGIYLGGNLNLYSKGIHFDGSSDNGRVVLVRESAEAKNS
ncbi:MAG TPA: hypothetical protein VI544_00425 [Candidatus Nanoarchaeia archaeon]|nr:hypothetical protein [Candidatus Nanoarchaeia archaeon]